MLGKGRQRKETWAAGRCLTHLVPVLIREFLARMPPLNPGAVEQNLWFDSLTRQRRDDPFDCLSIGQLCHVDPSLSTQAVGDFVAS